VVQTLQHLMGWNVRVLTLVSVQFVFSTTSRTILSQASYTPVSKRGSFMAVKKKNLRTNESSQFVPTLNVPGPIIPLNAL